MADASAGTWGSITAFQSPWIGSTGPQCRLKFAYWMKNEKWMGSSRVGTLSILILTSYGSNIIWEKLVGASRIQKRLSIYIIHTTAEPAYSQGRRQPLTTFTFLRGPQPWGAPTGSIGKIFRFFFVLKKEKNEPIFGRGK